MFKQNEIQYKIILFDGFCNFCNYWVNFVLKRDKKNQFKFAALQSEKGRQVLEEYNLPINDFDSFILISNSTITKKSSAIFEISKDIKGWPRILFIFQYIPVSIRDFLYDIIARNRYKIFGKKDVCKVPSTEEKNKFLL